MHYIDDFTGTSNDDVFAGVASSLTSEKTLNAEDKIQGGAGSTAFVTLSSATTGTSIADLWTNLQAAAVVATDKIYAGMVGTDTYVFLTDGTTASEVVAVVQLQGVNVADVTEDMFTTP